MFWKKKCYDQKLLQGKVIRLEERVKQLECEHNFIFKKCVERYLPDLFGTGYGYRINYDCPYCGKQKVKYWKYHTKKEQQALKTLNLVPEDWEVKIKGGNYE